MLPGGGPPLFNLGDEVESVPGLRYVPGWLDSGSCDTLLSRVDEATWSTGLKRRVQHYGHRYDYGRRNLDAAAEATAPPVPAWAGELAARLVAEGFMAHQATQVIVNEYLPGQGISPHVDCVPCFGPVVAAVSLGSACVMDFQLPGGDKVPVPLAAASLCVMSGPARYQWRHGIAARKTDPSATGRVPRGRRVSVTFRTVIPPVS